MRRACLLVLLAACTGDKNPTTTESASPTDTGTAPVGFALEGPVIDMASGTPAADGLCVDLLDPSPAVTGGVPVVLQSTTTAGGGYAFGSVETTSAIGLLLQVDDCAGYDVFPTGSVVAADDYVGLGAGDLLAGQTAWAVSTSFLALLVDSAIVAGYTGDLAAEGFVVGFVRDAAGLPVGGATVGCSTCGPTFYIDADPTDGLFTGLAGVNTATDAGGSGAFVIPAGPIESYQADDGGVHTWPAQLNGSNPGFATVAVFVAQ